jgi:hypothetical protein
MDTHLPRRQVIELRQYLLHHDRRDELIDLFDQELVEPQEAAGMSVIGQFRDPDRPDYFVWLRGFPDMAARHTSLTAFYDGPVWAANARRPRHRVDLTTCSCCNKPTASLPTCDPSTGTPRPGWRAAWVIEHPRPGGRGRVGRFQNAHPRLELTGPPTIGRRPKKTLNT